VSITFIAALLFLNSRLVLCQIFSYDFPKIRNLPKIFLRSFENVGPDDKDKKNYGKPFSHLIRICRYLQLITDISN